jgi:hypothetical protein
MNATVENHFASVNDKLTDIQAKLKAPKAQMNSFGKYKYRSCEDILALVKPLLGTLTLTITDDLVMIGERYYVKATATVSDGKTFVATTAFAREALAKKGMDDAQVTGSASSYARKYALNGLFCIDDTADPDATNDHGHGQQNQNKNQGQNQQQEPKASKAQRDLILQLIRDIKNQVPSDTTINWVNGLTQSAADNQIKKFQAEMAQKNQGHQ